MFQIVWLELPARDIERAIRFYKEVFQIESVEIIDDGVRKTANLFYDTTMAKPGISLNQTANFEPFDKGIFVYLDCGEDLTPTLNRVEAAGGKILMSKTSMGGAGYYAPILDTEGNQIGLYSTK